MLSRFLVARAAAPQTRRLMSMTLDKIQTIGVVGAGQMGAGIALVAAQNAKLKVIVMDSDQKSRLIYIH